MVVLEKLDRMKRASEKPPEPDSSLRLQTMQIKHLEQELVDFRGVLAKIDQVIENAKAADIDGATKLKRARELAFDFSSKAINGLRKAIRKPLE